MKFSSRVDIAAPAEFVFDQIADFASFEHAARRRGVSLRRIDALAVPGPGMSWEVGFHFRGRLRQLTAEIIRFERPAAIDYSGKSHGFELLLSLQITVLAPGRSRLHVMLDARPRTLGARLLLQSAKLGRSRLERSFEERVATFGAALYTRFAAAQSDARDGEVPQTQPWRRESAG